MGQVTKATIEMILKSGRHGQHAPLTINEEQQLARAWLAAANMRAILDELEDSFDKQIYPEQLREDFNAPDDREYSVNITAKQWRAFGRALSENIIPEAIERAEQAERNGK